MVLPCLGSRSAKIPFSFLSCLALFTMCFVTPNSCIVLWHVQLCGARVSNLILSCLVVCVTFYFKREIRWLISWQLRALQSSVDTVTSTDTVTFFHSPSIPLIRLLNKLINLAPFIKPVLPTVRRLRRWPCSVEFDKELCMNTGRKSKRCVTLSCA